MRAKLGCNEIKMYRELDRIGAYPENSRFHYLGREWQIITNKPNSDTIEVFDTIKWRDRRVFKKRNLFYKTTPSAETVYLTAIYTTGIIYDEYEYEDPIYYILKFNKKLFSKYRFTDKHNYFKQLLEEF